MLIEKAVGSCVGNVDFYEDDLTGKNNYILFDPLGNKSITAESLKGNVFCLHKSKHRVLINNIITK